MGVLSLGFLISNGVMECKRRCRSRRFMMALKSPLDKSPCLCLCCPLVVHIQVSGRPFTNCATNCVLEIWKRYTQHFREHRSIVLLADARRYGEKGRGLGELGILEQTFISLVRSYQNAKGLRGIIRQYNDKSGNIAMYAFIRHPSTKAAAQDLPSDSPCHTHHSSCRCPSSLAEPRIVLSYSYLARYPSTSPEFPLLRKEEGRRSHPRQHRNQRSWSSPFS